MNWQSAKSILLDAEGHPCSVSCEDGTVYTNFETQHSIQLDSWSQLLEQKLLRIVLYKTPKELLKKSYTELYIQQLKHGDILAVSQLATKAFALKTLLEYWRVSPEEVVAFGDDVNDLGFITLAGTGIAVQNAEERVKQNADMVCESNDKDGPALWLNKYLLNPLMAK